MTGYFVIFCVAVVASVCYYVVTYIQTSKLVHFMKKQTSIESLLCESLKLSLSLNQLDKELEQFPAIKEYLSQCELLLSHGPNSFEKIRVKPMRNYNSTTGNPLERLLQEIVRAPENLQNLVFQQRDIINKVAQIRHPIFVLINNLKVNFILLSLRIVLKLLGFIGAVTTSDFSKKYIPTPDEIKTKSTGVLATHGC